MHQAAAAAHREERAVAETPSPAAWTPYRTWMSSGHTVPNAIRTSMILQRRAVQEQEERQNGQHRYRLEEFDHEARAGEGDGLEAQHQPQAEGDRDADPQPSRGCSPPCVEPTPRTHRCRARRSAHRARWTAPGPRRIEHPKRVTPGLAATRVWQQFSHGRVRSVIVVRAVLSAVGRPNVSMTVRFLNGWWQTAGGERSRRGTSFGRHGGDNSRRNCFYGRLRLG